MTIREVKLGDILYTRMEGTVCAVKVVGIEHSYERIRIDFITPTGEKFRECYLDEDNDVKELYTTIENCIKDIDRITHYKRFSFDSWLVKILSLTREYFHENTTKDEERRVLTCYYWDGFDAKISSSYLKDIAIKETEDGVEFYRYDNYKTRIYATREEAMAGHSVKVITF